MSDEMRVNDELIAKSEINQLKDADQIAQFFTKLRYDVTPRRSIPPATPTYAYTQNLQMEILRHELIAKDPIDEDICIYLFEVRSVTAKLRNELASGFSKDTKVLLVLTVDYADIEFIYLETLVKKNDPQKNNGKPSLTIRPIPLTVNRLDPSPVALRVLKRFTFTEEDSDYQWEKLRSAYILAEWSEPYFNNRALFSDYYLNNRLQNTPEWNEAVRPIGREVEGHLSVARKRYTRQAVEVIRSGLFEPLFKLLGFVITQAPTPSSSATPTHDYYLLSAPETPTTPIVAVLAYVWNRHLDDVDESRELDEGKGGAPFMIPGAQVVSLLEDSVAPWVIVTNGKLWRLYSSTASNKATNYYEVDLEEAAFANDYEGVPMKYWWLMFRRQAFTGFLDALLKGSADYAKELGERLKDRVFVEIFPQFAKGFIANMRERGMKEADLPLDTVFIGTMTFLYRLMFILYAESLELVPINEVQGYRELSLYRMKGEIAEAGGKVFDEAGNKLTAHYSETSTALYEWLRKLFVVIDKGSDELNMPTYNGGLFSSETESGKFLAQYDIPDSFLARGLDRLSRDVDPKTYQLVFIDFKSLGVRQLGSIYEGLLEFKLKIATEPLAVTKEKGKEVYQPAQKVKKPLATLAQGEVYLQNDKQERKATGSYYTPDYIVKYIVRHTVGPVLDRKFEELQKPLRQAQKDYRSHRALLESRRKSTGNQENLAEYWNNPTMQQLVDDCLNVRVLDPAMGSGHFLVEVVDYISNRLITFLNGWTENPVWAFLDRTRQDILDDMERQHVSIDADRLTRVALLKRAVLKRCIYGVDLNQMAVELAKVSLWLDAFTLGAPLSFLDHHLKHGNSLIGARIADVKTALEGDGQLSMFSGSKFAGVMMATDLMRQVSYLSDNTMAQAHASKEAYRSARDHLAPYKRVLDVYTSRWFGNTPTKTQKQTFDPTIEFLKRTDTRAWLQDPRKPANRLPADDYMKAGLVAKTALKAAEEKHFFHWELEFPEVFFAPSQPGGQDVQLRQDGGFDAVVGNPPYGSIVLQDGIASIRDLFTIAESTIDSFALFIEQATNKLSPMSRIGYIIPNSWQTSKSFIGFRKLIVEQCRLQHIVNLPYDIFKDAYIDTMILVAEKNNDKKEKPVVRIMNFEKSEKLTEISDTDSRFRKVDYERWFGAIDRDKEYQFLSFLSTSELDIFIKVFEESIILGDITDIQRGISPFHPKVGIETSKYKRALDGELLRYHYVFSGESVVLYDPSIAEYKPLKYFVGPRIILRQLISRQFRLQSILVTEDFITNQSHQTILIDDDNYSLYYLQGLLNSNFLSHYYVRSSATALKDDFPRIVLAETKRLPIPKINFTTSQAEREQRVKLTLFAYDEGDDPAMMQSIVNALVIDHQTDVVHDVLAHLAQRMIDLNKDKQTEVKRFLTWLETTLAPDPQGDPHNGSGSLLDTFTGKTIIQGYLGDYQKGEPETTWKDFHYRLYQNRNRFSATLSSIEGKIEAEYEKSLATLMPIKRTLARTDALIDKIVYRLYGLTDDEIELIERPQYVQALTEAKAQVVQDEKKDDEEKLTHIADGILSASNRFFERVETPTDEEILNRDLPQWRTLPPDAPKFLLTGDYTLRTLTDEMDFSSAVIPYTKAVEVVLHKKIFLPFRDQHTDEDCQNEFLQKFMRREKDLTLGSYMIILSSSKETALRNFIGQGVSNVDRLVTMLGDTTMRDMRNHAAHANAMTREEAKQIRVWTLGILGMF